uniref:Uncharacterized protein n=1 Tax=Romanomermis culicivorax TaxID=13658 RepID=A0A915JLQ6_ROMCU
MHANFLQSCCNTCANYIPEFGKYLLCDIRHVKQQMDINARKRKDLKVVIKIMIAYYYIVLMFYILNM